MPIAGPPPPQTQAPPPPQTQAPPQAQAQAQTQAQTQAQAGGARTAPPPHAPVSASPVSANPVSANPVSANPISPAIPTSPAVATPDTVMPVHGSAAGAATALTAPTMMTPIVVRLGASAPETLAHEEEEDTAPAEDGTPDPEQVLAAKEWHFHPETLRELVDNADELREIRDQLTEKLNPATDNPTRARLLSLRAVVSRILGDLSKALSDGKMALVHAEATGELRRIAIAKARLAHVLQWRGDFTEADRLFAEANSSELPDRLRATLNEHAGRSCLDQGRYMEAFNHFEAALELRKVEDPELIARTELALDAVSLKIAENGMGPYPRSKEEILQVKKPPTPRFDDRAQCWGFVNADGKTVIKPAFADVQPFRDGVAWVRRREAAAWELIDEGGNRSIAAEVGLLGVGSFSEGLAWVSKDGNAGWIAIDKYGKVAISTGFEDVRPFRRGLAAVRRGGWGAVDKNGRVVVPFQFTGFATALTDGRYVDGFSDEGLAIVDAGGRKGVVDRAGKMIVPPVHPALVIHPVAFLIASAEGRWGALDRKGRPFINPLLPSRQSVMEELDRLLADTKPVL
ncbi:MAG TPA: WG repeat-containing protein [Candidatus Limnocylindrales bacterium]